MQPIEEKRVSTTEISPIPVGLSLQPSSVVDQREITTRRVQTLEQYILDISSFQSANTSEQAEKLPCIEKIEREYSSTGATPVVHTDFLKKALSTIQEELNQLKRQPSLSSITSPSENAKKKARTEPVEEEQKLNLSDILLDTIVATITNHCDKKTLGNMLLVSKQFHTLFSKNGWNPNQLEALTGIERDPSLYAHLSPTLRTDKIVITRAISKNPSLIFELPASIEQNIEFSLFMNGIKKMAYLSSQIKGNKDLCDKLLREEPGAEKCLASFAEKTKAISSNWFHKEGWLVVDPKPCFEDRELAWAIIQLYNTNVLRLLESFKSLRTDKEIILAAVSTNSSALCLASTELKSDKEIVLAAVSNDSGSLPFGSGTTLGWASPTVRKDRKIVLAAIKRNGFALKDADISLQQDRELILAAIAQNGNMLSILGTELQNDKDVVLAAVRHNGCALEFASDELKNSHDVVMSAVSQDGNALQFASSLLQDNEEIVRAAVSHKPNHLPRSHRITFEDHYGPGRPKKKSSFYDSPLRFASSTIQNNKTIVLTAVQHNGDALEHAGSEARHDIEIVSAALEQNPNSLEIVGHELQTDKELMRAIIQRRSEALYYADEETQNNRELVRIAISQDGRTLQWASQALQTDKQMVLSAVSQNFLALQYASVTLQHDPEVLLAAAIQCEQIVRNAALQNAHLQDPYIGHFLNPLQELKTHKNFILHLVSKYGRALAFGAQSLQNNKKIVLAAVAQDGLALEFASKAAQNDRDIVLKAMGQNKNAIQFASKQMKEEILQVFASSL